MTLYEKLKNKKLDVIYETGYHFHMKYEEEGKLRWEAIGEIEEGELREEVEFYDAYEIQKNLYFVSWIEESGFTVSQILDFDNRKVYAYMSWAEDSARGNRGKLLHKGVFTII